MRALFGVPCASLARAVYGGAAPSGIPRGD